MGIPRRQKRLEGRHGYVDGIRYVMPIDSWESSAMIAAFPIDWDKARALIPPGDVHPFRMLQRGLLVVTVIDYRKTDIGAYIEYSLAIACTNGARPAPRLLPGVFQRLFGTGQYVFDLPVSTEVSVKGGKGIWGMPKHQANLDFVTGSHWVSSQYDLDGKMVSRFDVRRPKSAWLPINMGAANYCVVPRNDDEVVHLFSRQGRFPPDAPGIGASRPRRSPAGRRHPRAERRYQSALRGLYPRRAWRARRLFRMLVRDAPKRSPPSR